MGRFLVCLDDSSFSEAAVPAVRDLAEAEGGEVELLHVLVPPTAAAGEPWSGSDERAREERNKVLAARRSDVKERLDRVAAGFRVPVSVQVVDAPDAAKAIVEYAERHAPSLIALTTRSKEMLGKRHLGSVAEEVTLSGAAPVLLVYPPEEWSISPDALSEGCFVFTADGVELGTVSEIRGDAFRVHGGKRTDAWLAKSSVAAINTGRLVLHYTDATLDRHLVGPPA